jgi:hypothetical protein
MLILGPLILLRDTIRACVRLTNGLERRLLASTAIGLGRRISSRPGASQSHQPDKRRPSDDPSVK